MSEWGINLQHPVYVKIILGRLYTSGGLIVVAFVAMQSAVPSTCFHPAPLHRRPFRGPDTLFIPPTCTPRPKTMIRIYVQLHVHNLPSNIIIIRIHPSPAKGPTTQPHIRDT